MAIPWLGISTPLAGWPRSWRGHVVVRETPPGGEITFLDLYHIKGRIIAGSSK